MNMPDCTDCGQPYAEHRVALAGRIMWCPGDRIRTYVDESETPTPRPTGQDDVVKDLVEQQITAWAFAHDIDGAIRNDLIDRIRKALTGATSA